MAERSNNFVFEEDLTPPQLPGEGLQAMNFAHCSHIVLVIGRYKHIFGQGNFLVWVLTQEDLSMEEFSRGNGIVHGKGS